MSRHVIRAGGEVPLYLEVIDRPRLMGPWTSDPHGATRFDSSAAAEDALARICRRTGRQVLQGELVDVAVVPIEEAEHEA